MTNRTSNLSISQLLLLILIALLLWFIGRIRSKHRPRPATSLSISRRKIEFIVYRQSLAWHIPLFVLAPLLMLLLYLVGRMGLGTAIISTLVVLIIPAWNLYVLLYLQWRPLRTVPDEFWTRIKTEMYREKLQRLDGSWQFSNWSWYIRVSNHECILLRAEIIDFEKPIHHRAITMHSMSFKHTVAVHSHEYIFTGKDGSIIRTRMEQTPHITNWVKNHGGRFE